MDPVTRKWSIVFERIDSAVTELASVWLMIEATGDYDGAREFLRRWGSMPKDVAETLGGLSFVPVDIDPIYAIKWE